MSLSDDFQRRGLAFATCTNASHIAGYPGLAEHIANNFAMIYPEVDGFLRRYLDDPQPLHDLAKFAAGYGLKFALMPGVCWDHPEAWPVQFETMTAPQIMRTLADVFAQLRALRPAFMAVANEAITWDGKIRENHWSQALGPGWLEIVYRLARDNAPGVPLAYNDFVIADKHTRRVCKLRKVGCSIALIQGHAEMDGNLYGKITARDIDPFVWTYRINRMQVGFSEVDIEYSLPNEPSPAAVAWQEMTRTARRDRFFLFGLWGAADRHSWKREQIPTPWGLQDWNYYADKAPIIAGMRAGLGI